jgi:hypothetical protein
MSSKSKDKKAQRKAEQAAIQQRLNTVRAALVLPDGSVRDLLAEVKPFCRFDRGGVTAELSFFTPATMPEDVRAFVYDLTKLNMEEMYITAGWGWNEAKKKRELYEPDARFIVFRRATTPSDAGADSAVSAATAVSPGFLSRWTVSWTLKSVVPLLHFRYRLTPCACSNFDATLTLYSFSVGSARWLTVLKLPWGVNPGAW